MTVLAWKAKIPTARPKQKYQSPDTLGYAPRKDGPRREAAATKKCMPETADAFRRELAKSIELAPRIDTPLDAWLSSVTSAVLIYQPYSYARKRNGSCAKGANVKRSPWTARRRKPCNDAVYRRVALRDATRPGSIRAARERNGIFRTPKRNGRRARYTVGCNGD